jgi:hypothetical protein
MLKRICIRLLAILMLFCGSFLAPSEGRANSLSVGLNGISDWSTQHPFLDLMKTARPWIGHLPGQWGGVSFEELTERGVLNTQGWPVSIPAEVTALESLVLTDQPVEAQHLKGRYHVFYDGRGRFELTGRARVIRREDGHHVFDYSPGGGAVGMKISETDATDPIRNIRIIKEEQLELYEAGAVFNPVWMQRLDGFATLRFMDWMVTNNSPVRVWEDMPQTSDFSYAWRGVPVSKMINLANELDVDPWFNIPHLAEDAMVDRFAREVEAQLEPGRVAHIEYSNEVWNFIFDQARWAGEQAEAQWGDLGDGWMQFYGLRAAQVMDTWTDAFGASSEARLKRVVAVHTGWPGLEEGVLRGEKAREALGRDPVKSFDAYAVTGYFGYELSDPAALTALLDADEARVEEAGVAEGLSRVALREYVRENRFSSAFPEAAQMVRAGSLASLTTEAWPHHAAVARANGLELLMYEGGTHAAANWDAVDNERLVAFLTAFNYSAEMGALYTETLTAWSEIGGTSFNVFVDVAPPSQWGSWGALRHLDDDNPRWQALQRHLEIGEN